MKPTPEIIEEAARHGIVEGARFESAARSCTGIVAHPDKWEVYGDGDIDNGNSGHLYLRYNGKWVKVIAPPVQPSRDEVRDRIAKAEERIAEQDKTIAELKAKIDRLESANELLNELPPKWEPKAGDWVVVTEATWNNCPYKVGDIAKVTHRDSLHPWLEGKGSFTAGVCVVDECLRLATPEEIEAATRPKWEPKFGERVMTPRGEGIYWNKWLDKMHTVIFEDGSKNYNLEELSPIEP